MSNLSTQNPYSDIDFSDSQNPSLSPQSYRSILSERLVDQILSWKSSQGEARLYFDTWLVRNCGFTPEGAEWIHKQATSQLHSNLLVKWTDTYVATSPLAFPSGVILGGSGFFGGFGLAASTATFFGGLAFITLPLFAFGGAVAGGILGVSLLARSGQSVNYVPEVAKVYTDLIINAVCQNQLRSRN